MSLPDCATAAFDVAVTILAETLPVLTHTSLTTAPLTTSSFCFARESLLRGALPTRCCG